MKKIKEFTIRKGFCPVCQDRIIDEKGKIMPNQRQYKVVLTNGHTTHLAICKKHRPEELDFNIFVRKTLDFIVNELPLDKRKEMKSFYQKLEFIRKKG